MALGGTKDSLHLLKASHVLSVNRNKCGIISVDSSWSPLELAVDADREAIVFLSHALLSSQMPLTSLPKPVILVTCHFRIGVILNRAFPVCLTCPSE